MGKKWDKTTCGECKKLVSAENLIPDYQNNRYLCDGCYEPRETSNKKSLENKENGEENTSENNKHQYLKGELKFKRGI